MSSVSSRMFQPFSFANGITLHNRVVMEPTLVLRLPLLAIGKGVIMNPDWVALAQQQQPEKIDLSLNRNKVSHISIPDKLMDIIVSAKGLDWFPMHDD